MFEGDISRINVYGSLALRGEKALYFIGLQLYFGRRSLWSKGSKSRKMRERLPPISLS